MATTNYELVKENHFLIKKRNHVIYVCDVFLS